MRMKWNTSRTCFMVLFGAALTLPRAAQATEYTETQTYGIANFGGTGECGSSGQTHAVHTDTAAGFLANF